MKNRSVRDALLVCGLALVFSCAFFFLKHNPSLRDITPFGEDPYDAIGSLAFIAANLLAATCLARVLFPGLVGRSGAPIYVLRTEAAVSLCILVAISSDAIAMVRHLSQWRGSSGEFALLLILSSLIAASIGVLLVVCRRSQPPSFGRLSTAGIIFLGTLLCLSLYPESLIHNTFAHIITCDVADVLLVAPVAAFVLALFPNNPPAPRLTRSHRSLGAVARWIIVALLGFGVGLVAFLAEIRESAASHPLSRLAFVGSVYAYLGLSGLILAYAFFRKPLGFLITD